jgi:exodeoxyribonuclease VII large subunit
VINVPVQGPTAVPQIIDALKVLDNDDTVDVIVIARGGGSVEDLLPFSDEALCRAVFGARTPVVSAIGHETDAPLLDYVADLRASTPTDAPSASCPTWPRNRR